MAIEHPIISGEIWKDILGYPAYQVSNFGRIRSFITRINHQWVKGENPRRLLRLIKVGDYYHVRLHRNWFQVHVLVLTAFIGPCPCGMEACHNDGNGRNNHVSNLRWDTRVNNARDKEKHGTLPVGEKCSKAKLSEKQVHEIRRLYSEGMTITAISRLFPIGFAATSNIIRRINWKHI